MIREQNGIVPVAELLKSEYAILQSRGLAALRLIAEDGTRLYSFNYFIILHLTGSGVIGLTRVHE